MHTDPLASIESLLEAIGENLSLRLKQANLDQKDIAQIADLNRNTISSALSGSDIKLSTLIRITRTLDFSDWLAPLLEPPPVSPIDALTRKEKKRKRSQAIDVNKPISRPMGRKKES